MGYDLLSQQVEAKIRKQTLQQGLLRKQFELDDIEGQLDDIASHLDQARQQNEEWIRKQTRAGSQERSSRESACAIFTSSINRTVLRSATDEANENEPRLAVL